MLASTQICYLDTVKSQHHCQMNLSKTSTNVNDEYSATHGINIVVTTPRESKASMDLNKSRMSLCPQETVLWHAAL